MLNTNSCSMILDNDSDGDESTNLNKYHNVVNYSNIGIRHRRVAAVRVHNQQLITVFFTASLAAFMVIYCQVSTLLIPDHAINPKLLRHLTKGFSNDLPPKRRLQDFNLPFPHYFHHKPSVIVIGFSHCGTDHFLDTISSHPDVFVQRKDLHFFEGNNRTASWYISRMPMTLPHQVTMDASLNIIHNQTAMKAITSFNRKMRVIVITCNPVLRVLAKTIQFLESPRKTSDDINIETLFNYYKQIISRNQSNHDMKNGDDINKIINAMINETYYIQSGNSKNKTQKNILSRKFNISKDQNELIKRNDWKSESSKTEEKINEIMIAIKSEIKKSHDYRENKTRNGVSNSTISFRNINFLTSNVSKVYKVFPKSCIFVEEINTFLLKQKEELSKIFRFIGVNNVNIDLKNIPAVRFNSINSKMHFIKTCLLYEIIKLKERNLVETLDNLFTNPDV